MEDHVVTFRTYLNKTVLTALEWMPYIYLAHVVVSLPQLGIWRRTKVSKASILSSRRALHEAVAREVANEKILYLEFGVYQGDSIKYWAQLNSNPSSRFVGFDTFTGLPELWQRNFAIVKQNEFDTGGALPVINDDRCSFEVGLFQRTLRPFLKMLDRTQYDRVVIHLDADLYSATLFALCECDEILRSNDFLIFDEFSNIFNEFRALTDWARAYGRDYEVVQLTRWANQTAIRVT